MTGKQSIGISKGNKGRLEGKGRNVVKKKIEKNETKGTESRGKESEGRKKENKAV